MQFIPLKNFSAVLATVATMSGKQVTSITGTSGNLYVTTGSNTGISNLNPFMVTSDGTKTSINRWYSMPFASSATDIPYDTTTVLNQVGTTTISYTRNSTGWVGTISVTASEGDKINSLFFVREMIGNSSASTLYNCVLFAIKLDNEVTIDSTGTANFTFSVEF